MKIVIHKLIELELKNSDKHYVYIMSSIGKVLYVGMTNDLVRRMYEHKNKMNIGFTAR